MARVRMLFSKRGPFCFIRHVDLPQILSRSARRAGMAIDQTEGFSPHPKISLGPALPVGVVACAEPGEIWFSNWNPEDLDRFNSCLPEGLSVLAWEEVEGKALNKLCDAGEYLVRPQKEAVFRDLVQLLENKDPWDGLLYSWLPTSTEVKLTIGDPSQNGPGKIVKALVGENIIQGWTDIRIARLSVGLWDGDSKSVKHLISSYSGGI
ncbi:TIGR03936 family radical SAM-associated protein [Dethiosulfovibrio salsuginis]|uniref:Radical SAM-linked protein n=1 Tax=Dethiosulfovibrio salsuginis TaxID=561720 RepID=A0A1X7J9L1_9BACT|nr:TIGR03936 family radical SAM-associated protein [Dethiosulfovibrio salsuginis]SMG24309.1 radical SAM-linked protein [Dethiosulfovibrio salsuginis]